MTKALAAFGAPSIRYRSFGQGRLAPLTAPRPSLPILGAAKPLAVERLVAVEPAVSPALDSKPSWLVESSAPTRAAATLLAEWAPPLGVKPAAEPAAHSVPEMAARVPGNPPGFDIPPMPPLAAPAPVAMPRAPTFPRPAHPGPAHPGPAHPAAAVYLAPVSAPAMRRVLLAALPPTPASGQAASAPRLATLSSPAPSGPSSLDSRTLAEVFEMLASPRSVAQTGP